LKVNGTAIFRDVGNQPLNVKFKDIQIGFPFPGDMWSETDAGVLEGEVVSFPLDSDEDTCFFSPSTPVHQH
jgi:hypothetical protein